MKPQKALHLHEEEEKKKPKTEGCFTVFEKYDGWYGYLDIGFDYPTKIHSRAMRPIPALTRFSEEIMMTSLTAGIGIERSLPAGRLIFEILLTDENEFSILNGILNRSVGDCEATTAYLAVHDYIPHYLDGFDTETKFSDRYELAGRIVRALDNSRVKLVLPITVGTVDHAKEVVKQVWEAGGEGVILKRNDAYYSPDKRNADLMKIKEEIEVDLLAVDLVEGDGKYSGVTGAIVAVDSKGNEHHISGMTDAERIDWWNNRQHILGRVVQVKAMKRLPDGSLREPRFVAIRYDKLSTDID